MKIQYLGTAAAEGIPGMFCECEVCRYAREHGGKEIKTRSQALLDDKILLDFPADTYMHSINFGVQLSKIHTLVITHPHSDHLYERDFWCRSRGIAYGDAEQQPLHVYLTEAGLEQCKNCTEDSIDDERIKLHRVVPFEPFEAEGYKFTPLKADHSSAKDPVIYIIERNGKSMLYAHDTGYFLDETWEYLQGCGLTFSFVSLDCTGALLADYRHGHMGLSVCVEVYDRLKSMGLCDENTTACVNHFSHNGGATHTKMCEEAAKHGFLTSYDGMTVEF